MADKSPVSCPTIDNCRLIARGPAQCKVGDLAPFPTIEVTLFRHAGSVLFVDVTLYLGLKPETGPAAANPRCLGQKFLSAAQENRSVMFLMPFEVAGEFPPLAARRTTHSRFVDRFWQSDDKPPCEINIRHATLSAGLFRADSDRVVVRDVGKGRPIFVNDRMGPHIAPQFLWGCSADLILAIGGGGAEFTKGGRQARWEKHDKCQCEDCGTAAK